MSNEAHQAHEALTRGDGFAVLPGLLTAGEASEARNRVLALKDHATHNDDGILALSNMIHRDSYFAGLVVHPRLLALVHRLLGEDARLAAVGGRILMPGCQPGGLHVDYPYWAMNPGMPVEPALMLQVIWMLEPFTTRNGGTWVAPGSQAWNEYPEEHRFTESAIQATGNAGDAVVSHGLLWHRTAVNASDEPRVALLINYSQLAVQPMTEMGPFSEEFRNAASPELRSLLGFDHGKALRRRAARVAGYQ
jgi:ectoine hydroxylase-related dioxygenase (phytanoyl-CoA dioxygenase family)